MVNRKFLEFGCPSFVGKFRRRRRKRGWSASMHKHRGSSRRPSSSSSSRGERFEFSPRDQQDDENDEFELFMNEYYECYDHDDDDYGNWYYHRPFSSRPSLFDTYKRNDRSLFYEGTKGNHDAHRDPKKTVMRALQSGNVHLARSVLNRYNKHQIQRFFRPSSYHCLYCIAPDRICLEYLFHVERLPPCSQDFWGWRCKYWEVIHEQQGGSGGGCEDPISYETSFSYHDLVKIKKLYCGGSCSLCCTLDDRMHRLLVCEYDVEACRKYDCLGYEESEHHQHFKRRLRYMYDHASHFSIPVSSGVLRHVVHHMNTDMFRELESYLS